MTVQIRSAIEHLIVGVRRNFEAAGVRAEVGFGHRALAKHINQGPGRANRVVFVAHDPRSGAAGRLAIPEQVGPRDIMSADDPSLRVATVRALADWQRDLLVAIWAYDGTAPEDELAQEAALEKLVEDTIRAVHYVGFAIAEWGAAKANVQGERKFGRENVFALRITHPLFDAPKDVGYATPAITKRMTETIED